jgi:competence protein ComEC
VDKIKQRLAEINRQLDRNPTYYHRQAVSTAPLAFCAVGMMAGIIIQNETGLHIWIWLAAIGLCVATVIMLLAGKIDWGYAVPYLVLACFACLGAIRLASFYQPKANDIRNSVGDEPMLATIRGVIATKPYTDSNDWAFSKFTHTDRGSSFYLELTEAETVSGWAKTSGIVRVRVNEPVLDLKAGDYVQIYCWLDRFTGASNPGEFDIAKYLSRKGIFVGASVEGRDAIERLQGNAASAYAKVRGTLQKAATQALLGQSEPLDEADRLLLALVLGYRTNIDKSTIEAFRKTGLLHFICLSGMNFGMVILFVWWVCKTAGLMKPGRAVVCTITAVLFLLVVPENAPAFRAAVICFAFCASFLFRRRSNPFNSLALAAIVLLLIKPTGIFQADWQLSFASVLGILLFEKPINGFLHEKTSDWFGELDKPGVLTRIAAKIAPATGSAFAVSLAAWMTSSGILLYHFHTIQLLTSVWTVLASPLIGLVSFLGYLKLIIALFLPSVAAAMGTIVGLLADLTIWIVKLFADLDISGILIGMTNGAAILLFYGLIVFVFLFRLRNPAIKKVICTATAVVIIAMLALPKWQRAHSNNLVVTTLDVGHGQAILAELPGGARIIFDAGSLSRNDIGTRVVSPFLQYSGIGKIDALVISHGDIDHINGIPEVVDDCRTGFVYASNAFLEDKRQTSGFLRDELKQKNIAAREINDFPQMVGSATVKVLWPDKDVLENDGISDNDKSIVTMIEYAGRRILIFSDIKKFAQKEILRLYPDLKADVLIAPHHGSAKTLEPPFLDKIGPNIIISSCSESSYKKGQVIRQQSYYTGRDGAVTVHVSKQGTIEANTFTKEK